MASSRITKALVVRDGLLLAQNCLWCEILMESDRLEVIEA